MAATAEVVALSKQAVALVQQAVAVFGQQDYVRAALLFEQAADAAKAAGDAAGAEECYNNQAGCLIELEQDEPALAASDKAIGADRPYWGRWAERGRALFNLGRYEQAAASCLEALDRNSPAEQAAGIHQNLETALHQLAAQGAAAGAGGAPSEGGGCGAVDYMALAHQAQQVGAARCTSRRRRCSSSRTSCLPRHCSTRRLTPRRRRGMRRVRQCGTATRRSACSCCTCTSQCWQRATKPSRRTTRSGAAGTTAAARWASSDGRRRRRRRACRRRLTAIHLVAGSASGNMKALLAQEKLSAQGAAARGGGDAANYRAQFADAEALCQQQHFARAAVRFGHAADAAKAAGTQRTRRGTTAAFGGRRWRGTQSLRRRATRCRRARPALAAGAAAGAE